MFNFILLAILIRSFRAINPQPAVDTFFLIIITREISVRSNSRNRTSYKSLTGTLAQRLECSPMARETWVQSQVESYQILLKWNLIPPCLTLSIIRYGSRVKWSNPGNGVAPSPTPWCSSYRKGSLRVTLDYGR